MSKVENKIVEYGYDTYGCHHIKDFDEGSALIVNTRTGRERGIIEKVDTRKLRVFYRKADGSTKYASLNSIVGQLSMEDLYRIFIGEDKKYSSVIEWMCAD